MVVTSRLVWAAGALVALALAGACGSNGGGSTDSTGAPSCVPGTTQECACLGGTTGVQSCNADGKSFGSCQCGDTTGSSMTTSTSSGSGGSGGGMGGTCGDGIIEPSDHCDNPSSEFYCKTDCMNATTSTTSGSACAGHIYYAGKVDGATSVWAALTSAGGGTGLEAGNNACKALNVGADHVCDYTEVVAAAMAKEASFMAIPQGTTAWVQRTTTVNLVGTSPVSMGGTPSAPGPGGRCNDWTYMTNHIGDGEYASFDAAGTPTFHLDNDTIFDPNNPHAHTNDADMQCGGATRSILCCYQACM